MNLNPLPLRQSEIFLQEHIQRLELREDERRWKRSSSEDSSHGGRRRRHGYDSGGRRNQLPQRQPPPIKIPKFKGENDPNLYIEWEQKEDQIFNIHLVSNQEQVDLVVLVSQIISCEIFIQFLCIKHQLFKLYIVKDSKKTLTKYYHEMEFVNLFLVKFCAIFVCKILIIKNLNSSK